MNIRMTKNGLFFTVESDVQYEAFLAGGWVEAEPLAEKPAEKKQPEEQPKKEPAKKAAKKKQ